MLKGLYAALFALTLIAVSSEAAAQVYRCETASGVIYSDFPCSEAAEEIELDVLEPATQDPVEDSNDVTGMSTPAEGQVIADQEAGNGEVHTLSDFTRMLESQRQTQIEEIDRMLLSLRSEAEAGVFPTSRGKSEEELRAEISELETRRISVMNDYDALIAEAHSREQ